MWLKGRLRSVSQQRTPERHTDLQVAELPALDFSLRAKFLCRVWPENAPVVGVDAECRHLPRPEYPLQEVTHDATAYYLRQGEAPGRWGGAGAARLGLAGEVDPQALRTSSPGRTPPPATT